MKESRVKQAETLAIRRSEISFASYNPRRISAENRKRLKANLKRVGLLGGIVWNKRTGNLVSGHQKVAIIDELNSYGRNPESNDYELSVCVVDMSEEDEKTQNVFMNNRSAQGEFDDEMLKSLLSTIDNFEFAGMDELDLQILGLGSQDYSSSHIGGGWKEASILATDKKLEEASRISSNSGEDTNLDRSVNFYDDSPENQIKRHNEVKKIKNRIAKKGGLDNDGGSESYVVLSFDSPEMKCQFMEVMGYDPYEKYINGNEFMRKIEFGE